MENSNKPNSNKELSMKKPIILFITVTILLIIPLSMGLTWLISQQGGDKSGLILTASVKSRTLISDSNIINIDNVDNNDNQNSDMTSNAETADTNAVAKSNQSPTIEPEEEEITTATTAGTITTTAANSEQSNVYWSEVNKTILELEEEYSKVMEMILSAPPSLKKTVSSKTTQPVNVTPSPSIPGGGNILSTLNRSHTNPPTSTTKINGWANIASIIKELEEQREMSFQELKELQENAHN
jgi:hypothetical protein